MEAEEEDASHVNKPYFQSKYDTAPMSVTQPEVRDTEQQCNSEPTSESVEARLPGGDSSISQPQQPSCRTIEGISDVGVNEGEEGKEGIEEEIFAEESVLVELEAPHADIVDEAVEIIRVEGGDPIDIVLEEKAVAYESKEAEFSAVTGKLVERETSGAGGSAEGMRVAAEETGMVSSYEAAGLLKDVNPSASEFSATEINVALSSTEDAVVGVQTDATDYGKETGLLAVTKEDMITSADARGVVAGDIDVAASASDVELAEEKRDVTEGKVKEWNFKEEGMSESKEDTYMAKTAREVDVAVEVKFREEGVADIIEDRDVIAEVGVAEKQCVTGMVEERGVVDQVEEMKDVDGAEDKEEGSEAEEDNEEGLEAEEDNEEGLEAEEDNEEGLEAEEDNEEGLEAEEDNEDMTGIAHDNMETDVADEVEAVLREEIMKTEETEPAKGKRKRGKKSKASVIVPSRKKGEEDVCFICFDGGELVLCDRRGCPKAYHPACVNRDEAFFRSKGRWNCGKL